MIKVKVADEGSKALGTASVSILGEQVNRKYACIYNASDVGVWLAFGREALAGRGVYLAPGGHFEIDESNLWTGAVNGLAASGSGKAVSTVEFR